jgi:peptide-methionine (S)-S-oxide reductase
MHPQNGKYIFIFMIFLGLINTSDPIKGQNSDSELETATLASGCFWCTEAIFQQLDGVEHVASGYTGGQIKNPAYREVCDGTTGHAEAIQIQYDPQKISYIKLLEVFFSTHNPTTLNQQGADVGTQYRSAIFYHNNKQRTEAEKIIQQLNASGAWDDPIVTEITPASTFYIADDYHQNYFNNNSTAAYCNFVIVPKIEKFKKVFNNLLKEER